MAENNENRRVSENQIRFFEFLRKINAINEHGLVVMAPTTDKKGFRIYKNGGFLAEVKKEVVNFLPNQGYGSYVTKALANDKESDKEWDEERFNNFKEKYNQKRKYWDLINEEDEKEFGEFLEICCDAVEAWSTADKQTHEERKKETEIISNCREQKDKGFFFVDMEFYVYPWKKYCKTSYGELLQGNPEDGFDKRGGRVDLVVYDPDAGFGLIELKYDCESMKNLGKHFADFDGINNSTKKSEIINELKTRLEALSSVGIMDDSINNIKEKLWFGFLLLGSNEEKYKYELNKDDNWNCFETHKKKKIIVDWMNLKKAIESKKSNTDFKFIWFKKFEDKNFSLCKADFQSYKEFMK